MQAPFCLRHRVYQIVYQPDHLPFLRSPLALSPPTNIIAMRVESNAKKRRGVSEFQAIGDLKLPILQMLRSVECSDMKKITGNITVPADCDVWPHEMRTARALAAAGHDVRFVRKSELPHARTADLIMDGNVWEMKAPKSSNIGTVQRNLRRGLGQSRSIIFDSRRMKGVPDAAIERELRKWAHELRTLDHLIMVNRHAEVIDIC